jgi:hypothetical protein
MSVQLVSHELWARAEPLVPKVARRLRYPGRKRMDDRCAFEAIRYVLRTVSAGDGPDRGDRLFGQDGLAAHGLLDEISSLGEIDWTTGLPALTAPT